MVVAEVSRQVALVALVVVALVALLMVQRWRVQPTRVAVVAGRLSVRLALVVRVL